jgi:hypothetical protein
MEESTGTCHVALITFSFKIMRLLKLYQGIFLSQLSSRNDMVESVGANFHSALLLVHHIQLYLHQFNIIKYSEKSYSLVFCPSTFRHEFFCKKCMNYMSKYSGADVDDSKR